MFSDASDAAEWGDEDVSMGGSTGGSLLGIEGGDRGKGGGPFESFESFDNDDTSSSAAGGAGAGGAGGVGGDTVASRSDVADVALTVHGKARKEVRE